MKSHEVPKHNARFRMAQKAIKEAAGDRFFDISVALERLSPWMAEHITTGELQIYIEILRRKEAV